MQELGHTYAYCIFSAERAWLSLTAELGAWTTVTTYGQMTLLGRKPRSPEMQPVVFGSQPGWDKAERDIRSFSCIS